jgi:hypothetical protein
VATSIGMKRIRFSPASLIRSHAHSGGDLVQPFVARPQSGTSRQTDRGEKMNIDISYPESRQRLSIDQVQHFVIGG